MKVAVIGGGSSYTPELINGFLARIDSLPLAELLTVQDILDNLGQTNKAYLPQFQK